MDVHRITGRIVGKRKRCRWYVLTLEMIPSEKSAIELDERRTPTQVVYVSKQGEQSKSVEEDIALFIHSIIAVRGNLVERLPSLEEEEKEIPSQLRPSQFFLVDHLQWIQCPPNLRAISTVLHAILRDSVPAAPPPPPISVLIPFQYHTSPKEYDSFERTIREYEAHKITLTQLPHWVLRGLQGGSRMTRARHPRLSRADREVLQRLEPPRIEPRYVPLLLEHFPAPKMEPRSFAQPQSARGSRTRQEYMQYKKEPQVQWLFQRILELLPSADRPLRIMDIGGGRGDGSVQLARWLPQCRITVVDRNPLTAAQEWAQQQRVDERLTWVQADFRTEYLLRSSLEEPTELWDCIVAWHACGDLTDAALLYAQRAAKAFIICPCCYNKVSSDSTPPYVVHEEEKEDLPVIQRLAETSQDLVMSRRAAVWINDRRIATLPRGWRCQLDEFSPQYSARNLVLVGFKDEEEKELQNGL